MYFIDFTVSAYLSWVNSICLVVWSWDITEDSFK